MKKLIFLFVLTFSFIAFSQVNKLNFEDVKFDIEVDESIYIHKKENSYFTETQSSAMQFNLLPKSYGELKKRMLESQKESYKEEIEINDVKMLLMRTTQVNDDVEYTIAIYCKEINTNSTLVLNSFYKTEEEKIMKPLIEKAVLSAKLKE
ncbi:hypothetical protein BTO05_06525 [Winogradskyella sp. PC-19]|uniref:hypothetical protein n=1 Tax=unclassified Winogradskyella TaxID=2615021 RepID=UPI000B3CF829|nr:MULTISPECIES: hypothetical protein [unclassified Winogradskyella]ARV09308.1 hypothetical protein BTO05_06525 [Winogradskyella sp. PC-19]RZN81975.1 MAG: hypothetical protein EVB12_03485 [Winogradskyella sp.]